MRYCRKYQPQYIAQHGGVYLHKILFLFPQWASFSHHTHFCWSYLDFLGITLHSMAEYPKSISLLVYYNYYTMAINIPLGRSTAKFINIDSQPIFIIKTINHLLLPFIKGFIKTFISKSMVRIFWWKVRWLGSLYLPDYLFPMIPRNAAWYLRKDAARIHFDFFCTVSQCFVNQNSIHIQLNPLRISSYIIKCWSNTSVYLTGHLIKSVR